MEYRPGNRNTQGAARARQQALRQARQRRRRYQIQAWARLGFLLLILLVIAGIITAIITAVRSSALAELEQEAVVEEQESILAPLPFQSEEDPENLDPRNIGPRVDSTTLTPLTVGGALPACGTVETSYFADAAFLGDSITEGLSEYDIDLSGALVCGYIGAAPNQIVNRTALTHPDRGEEVPLDVLTQAQPAKLYILMGTNTLVNAGNDESFLNYYDKMLEELRNSLPNTILYVQSILPVRPDVKEKSPGLDNTRLAAINQSISQIAVKYGAYYLDLWETFADEEGNLREDIAQPDGIHLTVPGYQEWVTFLCNHPLYNKNNPYLLGSDYSTN